METQEAADLQPLILSDPCRLRVAAARAFAVVKNRDVAGFEGVMRFLEATHTLLPRLVPPIKHMKIMFGLKTLVIMGMLQAGRSPVDTVLRTNQFFPSNLPQYQDHCNQHHMFLMRKNHLEFKVLAQTLAINKSKLDLYLKSQMEQEYGEHYAQKLEDRFLHYLCQLEALLPQETGNDKQQRRIGYHADPEENLPLDPIISDSTSVRRTVASCGLIPSEEPGPSGGLQKEHDDDNDAAHRQEGEDGQTPGDGEEAAPSPQFCSKHGRWVRSILSACPEEQLLLQARASPPLLRSSSSSTSSSLDLTPSGIVPPPVSHSSPHLQVPEGEKSKENLSSGSSLSLHQTQPQVTESSREEPEVSPDPLTASSVVQQGSSSHPPNSHSPKRPPPLTRIYSRLSTKFRRAPSQFPKKPSSKPFGEALMSSSCVFSRPQGSKPASQQTLPPVRPQASPSSSFRRPPHTHAALLRLSLHSQALLLHSRLFQPQVRLVRLREDEAPPSLGPLRSEEEGGEDHDSSSALSSSSFDVNTLYSSSSSSSGVNEDDTDSDFDYRPAVRRKRRRP